MTDDRSIEVVELLRRREEEFVTVWKCEQEICGILSMPDYPFPAVPELPSRGKSRKPVLVGRGRGRVVASPEHLLRGLDGVRENAYRIVYEYHGKEEVSFQTDRVLVQNLLGLHMPEFAVRRVETVDFRDMETWQVMEVVWKATEEALNWQGDGV